MLAFLLSQISGDCELPNSWCQQLGSGRRDIFASLVGLAHGHMLMGPAHEHLLIGQAHEQLLMSQAHEHLLLARPMSNAPGPVPGSRKTKLALARDQTKSCKVREHNFSAQPHICSAQEQHVCTISQPFDPSLCYDANAPMM